MACALPLESSWFVSNADANGRKPRVSRARPDAGAFGSVVPIWIGHCRLTAIIFQEKE